MLFWILVLAGVWVAISILATPLIGRLMSVGDRNAVAAETVATEQQEPASRWWWLRFGRQPVADASPQE